MKEGESGVASGLTQGARGWLTRLWPDTFAGRIILVLMASLGILHVFSIWAYSAATVAILDASRARELADRLLSVERSLDVASAESRDAAAHALSGEGFAVHWSHDSLPSGARLGNGRLAKFRDALIRIHPEFEKRALHMSLHQEDAGEHRAALSWWHPLLISMNLADGSRVNVATAPPHADRFDWQALLLSTTAMATGILAVSVLLVRTLTTPWKTLARAADHASIDTTMPAIEEAGPREMRVAARAFNNMLTRIRRLVAERAYTLAAISHDLRTPLTRQRLRLEFIDDAELRDRMQRDLDDMEAMVDSSLAYLRGDGSSEERRRIDLSALLQSICDDASDAGHDVDIDIEPTIIVTGGPLALKRALTNLLDNAVKYGKRAHVSARAAPDRAMIVIDDEGPGIPLDQRERVFEPFYRVDRSRRREPGGSGLGLTVARTFIRANRGDLRLDDNPAGGLRVEVTLPRT